jgi:hypothetical protein
VGQRARRTPPLAAVLTASRRESCAVLLSDDEPTLGASIDRLTFHHTPKQFSATAPYERAAMAEIGSCDQRPEAAAKRCVRSRAPSR